MIHSKLQNKLIGTKCCLSRDWVLLIFSTLAIQLFQNESALAQAELANLRTTALAQFCDCHTRKSVDMPIQLREKLDQKVLADLTTRQIQGCVPVSILWDEKTKDIKYLSIGKARVEMKSLVAENPPAFNVPFLGYVHTLGVRNYIPGEGGLVEMDFKTDFFAPANEKAQSSNESNRKPRDPKIWKSHPMKLKFVDGEWGLYSLHDEHRITEMLGYINYKTFPIPFSRETVDIPVGLNGMGTFGPKPDSKEPLPIRSKRKDREHGIFGHPGQTSALKFMGCLPTKSQLTNQLENPSTPISSPQEQKRAKPPGVR